MIIALLSLALIVVVQVTIRCIYARRLYPDCDYCMYSLYDVILESGGQPGKDLEIAWGSKPASYYFCRLARRLLPFGVYSPRLALAFFHAWVTIVIFLLTFQITHSASISVLAAALYATTSSLIHTGTYVVIPENFDLAALPLLALCVLSPSWATAIIAGLIVAFMVAWTKVVNAVYIFTMLLLFGLTANLKVALVFLSSTFVFLVLSILQYSYNQYNQPVLEIFKRLYHYATQTQDQPSASRPIIRINAASVRSLWESLLREIPVLLFILILGPLFCWQQAGAALALLAWSAILVALIQNKLWRAHFFPALSVLAALGGLLAAQHAVLLAAVLLLGSISLYHFLKPLFLPATALSKYYWHEPLRVQHYHADEASFNAANFIRQASPAVRKVFVWGMQTQLYTLLEIPGPPPLPYLSEEVLWIDWRRELLSTWLQTSPPPEYIFFCDPYFRYFPVSILEGLIGRKYKLLRLFGELGFPLYKLTEAKAEKWQINLSRELGLHPILAHFRDYFALKQSCPVDYFDKVLEAIKKAGISQLYFYGKPDSEYILKRCKAENIAVLGTLQTYVPQKQDGITSLADFPWPVAPDTGFLIVARSHKSIAQIKETIVQHQPLAKIFALVDGSVITDWVHHVTQNQPLIVYGLGVSGRYLLDLALKHNIDNIYYYDRQQRIARPGFMSLASLQESEALIYLGAEVATNYQIYFSLLAQGVAPERMVDFGSIFNRSSLPGRFKTFIHGWNQSLRPDHHSHRPIRIYIDPTSQPSLPAFITKGFIKSNSLFVEGDTPETADLCILNGGIMFSNSPRQRDISALS